jgi:hypothetical protein
MVLLHVNVYGEHNVKCLLLIFSHCPRIMYLISMLLFLEQSLTDCILAVQEPQNIYERPQMTRPLFMLM